MGAAENKVNYNLLEQERTGELQEELRMQLEQKVMVAVNKGESLVRLVLQSVVNGDYERGRDEIDAFIAYRSDLPNFGPRVERYAAHCRDLINAIRAKRHFPGLSSLRMAKQQEILENVINHFEELKQFLKKIEQVYNDLRIEDMRSTVIVIKVLAYTVTGVLGFVFFLEVLAGLGISFNLVLDQFIRDTLDSVFSIF